MLEHTTYQARLTRTTLSIRVPYPPDLLASVQRAAQQISSAIKAMPEWAQERVRPFPEFNPDIAAFIDALDCDPVRDEFRRKSKKLGLSCGEGPFPISIETGTKELFLQVTLNA